MPLSTYALVTEEEAISALGLLDADRLAPALRVWSRAAASETSATVEVTGARTLVLVTVGGTGAGTLTYDLTAVAYDTPAELVAAIQASGGASPRWYARVAGPAGAASQDLYPTEGALNAAGVANQQTLDMVDNYGLDRRIEEVTDRIEDYCQRQLVSRTYREYLDRKGDTVSLWTRHRPVTSVTRFAYRDLPVIQVTNSLAPPACAYASVEVRTVETGDNVCVLRVVGGGSAAVDTIALGTLTLTTFAAAVNALSARGWAATLADSTKGPHPATDLMDLPAQPATNGIVSLSIPEWYAGDYLTFTEEGEIRRGSGWDWVAPGWSWLTGAGVDEYGFAPMSTFRRTTAFSGKRAGYLVEYTAGWAQTSLPARFKDCAIELLRMKLSYKASPPAFSSEGLGEYNYSRGGGRSAFEAEEALLLARLAQDRTFNFEQPV